MLQKLYDESRQMCIEINIAKTKVMVVDNTPINVNNVLIEMLMATYTCLVPWQQYSQDKEIHRRIVAGWAAHLKHYDIFGINLAICLKRHEYTVLPTMTYGVYTLTLIIQYRTNLWPHGSKRKEVCSTSCTRTND